MGKPAKVLTAVDVCRVLEKTSADRDSPRSRVVVLLSFKAGLRAAEIAGLEWSMVLGADGRLSDHISIADRIAKNGSGRRIPINLELRRALKHLRRLLEYPTQGPVIRSARGSHMTPRSIVNWFAKLYRELGFSGCSSHSGRRTFITQTARLLSKAGGSLRDVQELAGHRALTTTERYIEGDRDAQRKLVRML
ncbi:site-specific integrase [Polymorphobacter sp. PAMC 29334]|uniref:tyrosine-type recombinase/integrase n=1 Tax=Polymorphobacter sp. PAMC 29334 TaxID=2862331 RepID=UPI001C667C83|nr:site-specific integrase [Polymorphobacter sp. PAMC 29334]QYE35228.1 site-specific integrase [Polymorphobacter sp. PAMC 29334]